MTQSVPGAQEGERGGLTQVATATAANGGLVAPSSATSALSRTAVFARRQLPLLRELVLVATIFVTYQWLRGHSPGSIEKAFAHADLVERIQRWMAIDVELSFNRLFVETPWLANAASVWYQVAHVAVTVSTLVWLWFRHRGHYSLLRSTLATATLIGLAIYWIFPLAPPRFALSGAVDTMHVNPVLFAGMDNVNAWANLYAAMPSIHVAWATWCALAVVVATSRPWRHLAWMYPMITTFVVIGTANHYVLDVLAGIAIVVGAYLVVREVTLAIQRRRHPATSRGTIEE